MPEFRITKFFLSLAKVRRAQEHIAALEQLAGEWIGSFKTEIEYDPDNQTNTLVLKTTTPDIHIGLALGDAIHALSCAMDYAVSRVVPEKTGTWGRRVYFPTHERSEALAKSFETGAPVRCGCGRGEITRKGSNSIIRSASPQLERLIVDRLTPTQDADSVFWAVRKFDNMDKHNFIPVTLGQCLYQGGIIKDGNGNVWAESMYTFPAGRRINLSMSSTELAIVKEGTLSTAFVFGAGTPLPGFDVIPWLKHAAGVIELMIVEFEKTFSTLEELPADGAAAAPAI